MKFVQIIEFKTSRYDEINQVMDEWMAASEGNRTPTHEISGRDRDQPNTYLQIVEFPSYEEAMKNNDRPETAAFAQRMADLCDGPAIFRNLDVVREEEL
jgi:quinol monooxygenase YgiN